VANENIETELKLGLVDTGQLDRLLASLPIPEGDVEQANTYLVDIQGRLKAAGIMLRIRTMRPIAALRPKACVVTAKRGRKTSDGVFVADEYEQDLAVEAFAATQANPSVLLVNAGSAIRWVLDQANPKDLHVQGAMSNRRRVIAYEGLTLEIDETTFPGGHVDVEIEVETHNPEHARSVLLRHCQRLGVDLFNQPLAKYARFLQHTSAI
jgi:uncharacterized protein YjbK